jgi:hypothetical protein
VRPERPASPAAYHHQHAAGQPGRWYPGSSYNHRSCNKDGSDEDSKPDWLVHLVVVYASNDSITLYPIKGQVFL